MASRCHITNRYDALIVNSPIASVISNPRLKDNPIIACNGAFKKLTGYGDRDILGRNCRFLAGPATEPWLSETISDSVRKHRPVLVEILNYKYDGTPFRNAVMVAPIYDEQGVLEFFMGTQVEMIEDMRSTSSNRRMAAALRVKELSPRQRAVLAEMAQGHLNKQIAHNLNVCEQTVKMHRALVMTRLGAGSSAEAIRIAVEAGL